MPAHHVVKPTSFASFFYCSHGKDKSHIGFLYKESSSLLSSLPRTKLIFLNDLSLFKRWGRQSCPHCLKLGVYDLRGEGGLAKSLRLDRIDPKRATSPPLPPLSLIKTKNVLQTMTSFNVNCDARYPW